MLDEILLNWEPFILKKGELPCLVTYKKHMGGSHLSIVLIANLFLQGSKILFLTAYPMAKDNFLNQINQDSSKILEVSSIEDLENAEKSQAIIIESGNATLFLNAIKSLPDINERVVFIKNIEIFNEEIFDICFNHEKVIISGDIDDCTFRDKIPDNKFKTVIAFNQPEIAIKIKVPKLERWASYLLNDTKDGIITIKNEHQKYNI